MSGANLYLIVANNRFVLDWAQFGDNTGYYSVIGQLQCQIIFNRSEWVIKPSFYLPDQYMAQIEKLKALDVVKAAIDLN